MVFAKMKFTDGHPESVIWRNKSDYAWDVLHGAKPLLYLPFDIEGHTYRERQESLRNLAIDFQYNDDGETDLQLSYGEMGDVCDFFEREGRKYGLLREFRENCIC